MLAVRASSERPRPQPCSGKFLSSLAPTRVSVQITQDEPASLAPESEAVHCGRAGRSGGSGDYSSSFVPRSMAKCASVSEVFGMMVRTPSTSSSIAVGCRATTSPFIDGLVSMSPGCTMR